MPNIAENLLNSTPTSNLYCVWVTVQDSGHERLAAIWIDRAMTAFKSCALAITDEVGTAGIVPEQEQSEEEELWRCI